MLSYDTKKSTLLAAISRVLLYLCQTLFMPVTMLFTNITNDICYYAGCNRHNKWYECCHIIHLLPCGRCPTQTILYHNSTVTAIKNGNINQQEVKRQQTLKRVHALRQRKKQIDIERNTQLELLKQENELLRQNIIRLKENII